MDTLLTYYSSDVICRVIPGIIIIGLYGKHYVIRASQELPNSSSLLVVFIFLVAWLIGFMLDQVIFLLVAYPLEWLSKRPRWSWVSSRCNILLPNNQPPAKEHVTETKSFHGKFRYMNGVMLKGGIVLFRSLCCISVITFVWLPTIFSGVQWARLYSIIGAFVFLACWRLSKAALQTNCTNDFQI
jgi:hypothetical protein